VSEEIADPRSGQPEGDAFGVGGFKHEKTGQDLPHFARLYLGPKRRDLAAAQLVPVIEELDGGVETHIGTDLFHFGSNGNHHGRLVAVHAGFMPDPTG
jgi:hypothetical protein